MNENASDYVKIKDSLIEKDSNKKIIREVIKKKSSLVSAAPSIQMPPLEPPVILKA